MKKVNRSGCSDIVVERLLKKVLCLVGEDPERNGLIETPKRVAKAYKELLSGYKTNPDSVIKLFKNNGFHELLTVKDIEFYSLCEHHMLPFFGKIHIGYIPGKEVLGLSKFARIVEIYSKRLQTQENLTKQIFDLILKKVSPKGLIVVIEAKHLCVSMRGVRNNGSVTTTALKNGVLSSDTKLLDQFYRNIN